MFRLILGEKGTDIQYNLGYKNIAIYALSQLTKE